MASKSSKKGAGNMDELMSFTQAARARGVTRGAIADLVGRGRLRSVEVGGRPMVYRGEVEQFTELKRGPKKRSR